MHSPPPPSSPQKKHSQQCICNFVPFSVAQLDACLTGDQEAVGLTTPVHDHGIFSSVILSLLLIQEGKVSVSGERMCTMLINHLED